jgi:hypothetical protein
MSAGNFRLHRGIGDPHPFCGRPHCRKGICRRAVPAGATPESCSAGFVAGWNTGIPPVPGRRHPACRRDARGPSQPGWLCSVTSLTGHTLGGGPETTTS